MKNLVMHLMLTVTVGLMACGVVAACALSGGELVSALIGVAMATAFGCIALVLKSQATQTTTGGLQSALAIQGLAFAIRLVAILLGGFACKRNGIDPTAYIMSFFGCAMVHQAIEVKFLLSARPAAMREVQS